MKKPTLESMVGVWEGQLVSDSAWTSPMFRFRYYFKDENKKELKNDYLFGGVLSGTATVSDKQDHVEMYDVTGNFHDELRQINDSVLIGKYYSTPNQVLHWLPEGLSFIHVDRSKSSIFLPYILKKVGTESLLRNKIV
jgi:hypothetical protein